MGRSEADNSIGGDAGNRGSVVGQPVSCRAASLVHARRFHAASEREHWRASPLRDDSFSSAHELYSPPGRNIATEDGGGSMTVYISYRARWSGAYIV